MATDRTSRSPSARPLSTPVALVARVITAGLAAAMGGIHLHLWSMGYRHIHIIGILFLLNGIGGILLAIALLASPARLLGAVATLGTLFTVGTLVGLILSLTTGLFGFKESTGVPLLTDTVWVESAGIVTTALLAATHARTTVAWIRAHRSHPVRVGPARS